jgi:NAD(P)-dependent dehydrogenase (short-subunit alcohol dehydrogenase family)
MFRVVMRQSPASSFSSSLLGAQQAMDNCQRTVLVTGASSGIGRASAQLLAARGFRVWAGVRCDQHESEIRDAGIENLQPIRLEVTCKDQVNRAIDQLQQHSPQGLHALVNNAGVGTPSAVELSDLDELRRLLEVNTIGPLRMIQACLPLLRLGRGRVVNMSSMNGTVALPMVGAYSASKFALEALSDALRMELRPWGISVSVIRPGQVRTAIFDKARLALSQRTAEIPENLQLGYHGLYKRAGDFNERGARAATSPQKVAEVVCKALTVSRPRACYMVGLDARGLQFAQRVFPQRMLESIMARVAGVGAVGK